MKKVIILPLDNISNITSFMEKLKEVFFVPSIRDLIAYIKVNDACHIYDGGVSLLHKVIHFLDEQGLDEVKIFLDLKLADTVGTIKNTLQHYVVFGSRIGIVTLSTSCSVDGICAAKKLLPDSKIALVSLLTDISEEECKFRYNDSPGAKIVDDLFGIIEWHRSNNKHNPLPFDAVVCSALEVNAVRGALNNTESVNLEFIVPGIRDEWMVNDGDAGQQQRYTGVYEALKSGADILVMGAQITKGNPKKGITPEQSIQRTFGEIQRFAKHNMQQE